MKSRTLLALAAALALVLWIALRGDDDGHRGSAAPGTSSAAEAEGPDASLAARAEDARSNGAEDARSKLAPAAQEIQDARAPASAEVVRFRLAGRVLVPPGAPPDETLSVAALSREPRDPPALRAFGAPRANPAEFVRAPIARASVDVEHGGAFLLELEAEPRQLWVDVDGRWLGLAQPVRVPLPLGEPAEDLLLRPELGAWIHGTVEGAGANTPVVLGIDPYGAGTSQRFYRSFPALEDRVVLTDEQGAFELRGAGPGLPWRAAARPQGLGMSFCASRTSRAGAELVLDLPAVPAATLTGRVVDPSDPSRGVPGVDVYALPEGERGGVLWDLAPTCVTDAEGRFELAGVGFGEQVVKARTGTCESAPLELDVAGDADGLSLELDARASITGRVLLPDGTPARAAVELHGDRRRDATTSGGDGRFRFACLESGAQLRVVAILAQPDKPEMRAHVEAQAGDDVELVLAVMPAGGASPPKSNGPFVRVVDPDGRPVADAEVEFDTRERFRADHAWGQGPGERTDAFGNCDASRWWHGGIAAVALAPGYAPSEITPLPERGRTVDVALRPGGALFGTVYDERGVPQPRFAVLAHHRGSGQPFLVGTDQGGSYRFDALPPGEFVLEASPQTAAWNEKRKRARTGTAEVVAGAETRLDLGEPPAVPVRVFGRVRAGGEPVSAQLRFLADGAVPALSREVLTTDADGSYETVLSAGRHQMLVVSASGGSQVASASVVDVPLVGEHRLDVDLPAGRLVGRVLVGDAPSREHELVAFRVDGPAGSASSAAARTDDDGVFAFEGLAPGRYQVSGLDRRLGVRPAFALVRADAAAEVELHAEPCGELRLSLRDADGDEVVGPSVRVAAIDANGALHDLRVEQDVLNGGFAHPGSMPPGDYVLFASAPGLAAAPSGPHSVVAGETTTVVLELRPAAMLNVEIVDRDGDPAAARIVVSADGRTYPSDPSPTTQVMGAQSIRLSVTRVGPLAPALYTVTATAADGSSAKRSVRVDAGEERELRLRLRD